MAKISTQELFDEFFAEAADPYMIRNKNSVVRPEVFEFEKKIGKQFVDMNEEELIEMILTFKSKGGFPVGYTTYDPISTIYRRIFDYYSQHHCPIYNPWNSKAMKGANVYERLLEGTTPLTWSFVEKMIDDLYKHNAPDRAKYIECLIRMYHCGFKDPGEVVRLKECMINFRDKTVRLEGYTVQLDDVCARLLVEVHNMERMSGWRGDFLMSTWRDGYFKYPIRPARAADFDSRSFEEVVGTLSRVFGERVRIDLGCDINHGRLFYLGVYEKVVSLFGKERAIEIITSTRDSQAVIDLQNVARSYGLESSKMKQLRRMLRMYIPRDVVTGD